MTNDQIQSLDKCRELSKILKTVQSEINTSLNRICVGSNSNKGKELSTLVSILKMEISNPLVSIEKGIDKIVSEI